MCTDVVKFDPYKINSSRDNVTFDLESRHKTPPKPVQDEASIDGIIDLNFSSLPVSARISPKEWEPEVKLLISGKKWLQMYGLKKNRLDLASIIPQLGFKHSSDFDKPLKKPVCSRYGLNLFKKYFRSDGTTYNLIFTANKLKQVEEQLKRAATLYNRRLQWLTSESRRVFGVIDEKAIVIVLDIKTMSPHDFDQYRSALERVIREQVSQLAKFNIVRACDEMHMCFPTSAAVTIESINEAIQWLWKLDRCAAVSATATTEAVATALTDSNAEAVYLFTEGTTTDWARELLRGKLAGARCPVHVISFNCTNTDTVTFLKDLAKVTGGRFHAYAVIMEMDYYEGQPMDATTNQANVIVKKRTFGGLPPGAGTREDVLMVFEELEETRNIISQLQALSTQLPETEKATAKTETLSTPDELSMSSREWLQKHGLRSRKLLFYDILATVAFKHQDGVVDLQFPPGNEIFQTDAILKQKLVNAKYCDKFPHVRWSDGTIKHVHVTIELYRSYKQQIDLAMETFQHRIDWLHQGSREIFGTVVENQVYFLIDTSASMAPHIQFVKDKLFLLMQEQLRHKQKFNIVAFETKATRWRDRLTEVSEKNLHQAWSWIKALTCRGSTNTLAAIQFALSDSQTQAIYLLSDGRPDQPPSAVLSQVQLMPRVPINTISFNCSDREANVFLCQLAKETGGRFHYYSEDGIAIDGPEPWESEDIRLLKEEIELGRKSLEKIGVLRDECAALAWKRGEFEKKSQSSRESYSSQLRRPQSARSMIMQPTPPSGEQKRMHTSRHASLPPSRGTRSNVNTMQLSVGEDIYRRRGKPLTASKVRFKDLDPEPTDHTRTSLLRTLNTGEQGEWLLPETKEVLERQWQRQKEEAENNGEKKSQKKLKKKKQSTKELADSDSKRVSSREWLAIHGLAAQKLTIMDALSPTFIPHKSKYIPIIDKKVNSKVFDNLFPVVYVSSDGKQLQSVNPLDSSLDSYQKKVEAAVEKFKRRLDLIVWEVLPEDKKEEFGSDKPVSFMDNKKKLLNILEELGWPINEADVILLETEIRQGEGYIQQAQDLRTAAEKGGEGLERLPDADGDSSSARRDNKTSSPSREKVKSAPSPKASPKARKQSPVKRDGVRISTPAVTSDVRESGDRVGGDDDDKPTPPPSARTYEGLGEILAAQDNKNESKGDKSTKPRRVVLDGLKGQKVIARHEADGFYYLGTIVRCPNARHAVVKFRDIITQTVPTHFIIPVGGAVARPVLRVGDGVLARVVNHETGIECYVPGVIQMMPQPQESMKLYTVALYTGQKTHLLRSFLVKITRPRCALLIQYIKKVAEEEEAEAARARKPVKSSLKTETRPRSDSTSSSSSSSSSSSDNDSQSSRSDRSGSKRSQSSAEPNGPHIDLRKLSATQSDAGMKKEDSSSRGRRKTSSAPRTRTSSSSSQTTESSARHTSQSPANTTRDNSGRNWESMDVEEKLKKWHDELEARQAAQRKQQEQIQKLLRKLKVASGETETTDTGVGTDHQTLLQLLLSETQSRPASAVNIQQNKKGKNKIPLGKVPLKLGGTSNIPLDMRISLDPVKLQEEVLAVWPDDGWYYRGIVVQDCSNHSYFVQDSVGGVEKIWREDIIADKDEADAEIKVGDSVIALHPNYAFSYAPGVVVEVLSGLWSRIRFYDNCEEKLPREEVYRIPKAKADLDVAYIQQCEERWVGKIAVARNDDTGIFQLGMVKEHSAVSRSFTIQWSDGTQGKQELGWMFGPFTKRIGLTTGDYVLAIYDLTTLNYLPGMIMDITDDTATVKFCDGSVRNDIDERTCFWLSEHFYDCAVNFYHERRQTNVRKKMSEYRETELNKKVGGSTSPSHKHSDSRASSRSSSDDDARSSSRVAMASGDKSPADNERAFEDSKQATTSTPSSFTHKPVVQTSTSPINRGDHFYPTHIDTKAASPQPPTKSEMKPETSPSSRLGFGTDHKTETKPVTPPPVVKSETLAQQPHTPSEASSVSEESRLGSSKTDNSVESRATANNEPSASRSSPLPSVPKPTAVKTEAVVERSPVSHTTAAKPNDGIQTSTPEPASSQRPKTSIMYADEESDDSEITPYEEVTDDEEDNKDF